MNNKNEMKKTRGSIVAGKRILSVLAVLVCVLVLSGISLTVFAEGSGLSGTSGQLPQTSSMESSVGESAGEEYTVTFIYNGDAVFGDVQTVEAGGYATKPEETPPAPEGMAFDAWYAEGEAEAFDFANRPITANLVLTAGWKAVEQQSAPAAPSFAPTAVDITYTVQFEVDGEIDEALTAEVPAGALVAFPADPVGAGGRFHTWYLEGAPFSPYTPVTKDITLVAVFGDTYVVRFIDYDGYELMRISVDEGDSLPATLPQPTLPLGVNFLHWSDALNGEAYTGAVTDDLTLYAVTDVLNVAVFVTYGSEVAPQTGAGGGFVATQPSNPTRAGYSFVRWSATENGTDAYDFSEPIVGTTYIYAVWEAAKVGYVINFWNEVANFEGDPGDPATGSNAANYELVYTKIIASANGALSGSNPHDIDFASLIVKDRIYATGGTPVVDLLDFSSLNYVVAPDAFSPLGDTTVNLYLKRDTFTFDFEMSHNGYGSSNGTAAGAFKHYIELRDGTRYGYAGSDGVPVAAETYSVTLKLGQDITALWPYSAGKAAETESSRFVYTCFNGYHGFTSRAASTGYIRSVMGAKNAATTIRPQSNSVTMRLMWTNGPYHEYRCYYTELPAGETTHPTKPVVQHGGKYYTLHYTAEPGAYQRNSPETNAQNWPGLDVPGYLTINTPALAATYQTVEEVTSEVTNPVAGVAYYRINYFMPRWSYGLTLLTNGGTIADATSLGYKLTGSGNDAHYEQKYIYEAEVSIPTATPQKSGYTFGGWYTDAELKYPYVPGSITTMPGNAVTLYAKWIGTDVTVRYHDADGGAVATTQYGKNELLMASDLAGTAFEGVDKGDVLPGKGVFKGWFYSVNGVMVEASWGLPLTRSTYDLYPSFGGQEYTVTFMDDTVEFDKINVSSGVRNTLALGGHYDKDIVPPARTGYTFVGWYTVNAQTGGTRFHTGTPVTADITVYARFRANTHVVTYAPGTPAGATGMPNPLSENHDYDETVNVAAAPALTGYDFDGWLSSYDGVTYKVGGTSSFDMPDSDVTLTAQWTPVDYTLTYNKNDVGAASATVVVNGLHIGDEPQVRAVTNVDAAGLSWSRVTEGYDFNGWDTEPDGTGTRYAADDELKMPAGNVTLYAQWTVSNFTVTYNKNDSGAASASEDGGTLRYGTSVTTSAIGSVGTAGANWDRTSEGYSFAGWNTQSDGLGSSYAANEAFLMPSSNLTLYAQWTQDEYSLTYNANHGNAPATSTETGLHVGDKRNLSAIGSVGVVPANWDRTGEGYSFEGWDTQADGLGTRYAAGNELTMAASNVTLYAQWSKIDYSLTYNANYGSSPATETGGTTLHCGDSITPSAITSVGIAGANWDRTGQGYTFEGWNTAADGSGTEYAAGTPATMPAGNVTLYAQWAVKTYTVTFDTQQPLATPVAPITDVPHGNTIAAPAAPTFVGGVFEGWYKEAECLNEWNFGSDAVTSNITLYAKWTLNTYTVSFDSRGGSAVAPITDVPYGSTISAPQSPTFDGFRFKGWYTDPSCTTAWNFGSDKVTGDMTLYAKWAIYTPDFVTVTFDYNDGRGVYTRVTVSYGDGQNGLGGYLPASPTGSGVFSGWNMSPDGSGAGFTAGTPVTSDITVYAQWSDNDEYYRLSFNLNGAEGAPPMAQSLRAGSLATPVANPERTGYTFEGWNTSPDGSGSGWDFGSTTMPARNVTLYAQWSGGGNTGSTTSTTTSTTSGSSQPVGGRPGGNSTINIGGANIPLVGGNAHWALVNLILTVVGMLVALITLIAFFARKKEDTEEDENGEEVVVQEYKKHGGLKALSALIAIISVIVFIITENMRLPMALVDKWTILMAILLVGQLLVTIIGKRRKKEDDDEEGGEGEIFGKTSPSYTTD